MKSKKQTNVAAMVGALVLLSAATQAQTVTRPALYDSTGNKVTAVGALSASSMTLPPGAMDTTGAGQGSALPDGYVERTISQSLGPYFIVPGVEYPYENQVTAISYEAHCAADGYSGTCIDGHPPLYTVTDLAQSLCGGVYDNRVINVGPYTGPSNIGIGVTNITQVVCAKIGSRTITTLEKVVSAQATTIRVSPIDYASLRASLGANAINLASASGICTSLGHPQGVVPGSEVLAGRFYTCGNNTIGVWNAATGTWSVVSACTDNNLLGSLTCYK